MSGIRPEYSPYALGLTVLAVGWLAMGLPPEQRSQLWRISPTMAVLLVITLASLGAMALVSPMPEPWSTVLRYTFPVVASALFITMFLEVWSMFKVGLARRHRY